LLVGYQKRKTVDADEHLKPLSHDRNHVIKIDSKAVIADPIASSGFRTQYTRTGKHDEAGTGLTSSVPLPQDMISTVGPFESLR
jgi:hypothetical protein